MGRVPTDLFSVFRGLELDPSGRLGFRYKTYASAGIPARTVDTKWLCHGWGAAESMNTRFHVIDGKEEDYGWSCRIKIASGPYVNGWLDSSDGYLCAVGSSNQRWRFVGDGDHYEWWQGERPVVRTENKPASDCEATYRLRARLGATPEMYTISRVDF
ncbi:hypothetical protein [Nonomuraea dietziae]|uniref:hypothetical protein n=1 Tax=Nonomuraea dietziae TaxID=65515 RepID=UPI0033E0BA12